MTIRKAVEDSWSTLKYPLILNGEIQNVEGEVYWEKLRKFLEAELYEQFITLMNGLLKCDVRKQYTCKELVELINLKYLTSPEILNFLKCCEDKGKTPFIRLVKGEKDSSLNKLRNRTAVMTPSGVDKIVQLSGIIYVQITFEDLEKIRMSSGCATILDGGLVWIDFISDYLTEADLLNTKNVHI